KPFERAISGGSTRGSFDSVSASFANASSLSSGSLVRFTAIAPTASELQRLHLEELLEAELAELAAAARLLETAEGSQRVEAAAWGPAVTSCAPCSTPARMYVRTRSRCCAEASGPSRVSGDRGSPGLNLAAARVAIFKTSSFRLRGMSIRVQAEQVWPALRNA